jgi:alanine racemase
LRRSGLIPPSVDINVLGLSAPGTESVLLDYNLIPTVADSTSLKRFVEVSRRLGLKKPFRYHLKIDTGMGRIGALPGQLDSLIEAAVNDESISSHSFMEGVFTHFSKADEIDKSHSKQQQERFRKCVGDLRSRGLSPPLVHSANSAGIIDSDHLYSIIDHISGLNAYRMGISLYGFYPSDEVDKSAIPPLKPILTWKTEIIQLKQLEPGQTISYGGEYVTSHPYGTKIATLPVGYADGYRRRLGRNKPGKPSFHVLVRGKQAPIIGRVCMDMCHIDVTHIEGVSEGDEVVLIGSQGKHEITADQMASKLKTINYEISCLVGKRVPRLYSEKGAFVALKSLISDSSNQKL